MLPNDDGRRVCMYVCVCTWWCCLFQALPTPHNTVNSVRNGAPRTKSVFRWSSSTMGFFQILDCVESSVVCLEDTNYQVFYAVKSLATAMATMATTTMTAKITMRQHQLQTIYFSVQQHWMLNGFFEFWQWQRRRRRLRWWWRCRRLAMRRTLILFCHLVFPLLSFVMSPPNAFHTPAYSLTENNPWTFSSSINRMCGARKLAGVCVKVGKCICALYVCVLHLTEPLKWYTCLWWKSVKLVKSEICFNFVNQVLQKIQS